MIEIVNKTTGPLQLIVRSRRVARGFTTKIVPGRGRGANTVKIDDELRTEYIDRLVDMGLISIRSVTQVGER